LKIIKALELYLKHIKFEKNLSANTVSSYKKDIAQFKDYLDKKKIIKIDEFDVSIIRSFFKFIDNFKYSSKTVARKFSSIKNFLNYLEKNDLMEKQLTHLLVGPKTKNGLYDYLTNQETEKLLNSIKPKDFLTMRDKTILEMFYSTGARISEVQGIKLKNIDIDKREILITGKGRKERIIYISDTAINCLKKYLRSRKEYIESKNKKGDCGYLFINKFAQSITTRSIRSIVKKEIKKSGINKNIKPHDIRHSFATHLIQKGAGIREIQELLGHENISSTQIYTHLDIKKLKQDYNKAHPRNKD
jgi:site-specific recombinase XerD